MLLVQIVTCRVHTRKIQTDTQNLDRHVEVIFVFIHVESIHVFKQTRNIHTRRSRPACCSYKHWFATAHRDLARVLFIPCSRLWCYNECVVNHNPPSPTGLLRSIVLYFQDQMEWLREAKRLWHHLIFECETASMECGYPGCQNARAILRHHIACQVWRKGVCLGGACRFVGALCGWGGGVLGVL